MSRVGNERVGTRPVWGGGGPPDTKDPVHHLSKKVGHCGGGGPPDTKDPVPLIKKSRALWGGGGGA